MLSFVRWAAAGFLLVAACALSEGTDPNSLTDGGTGDGSVCEPTACSGKDNECGQRTCTNGACSMAYLPPGPATSAQIPGDCRTDTCDGKGSLASKIDDADIPDDKNPCTNDICTNGVASHTNGAAGVACGTGLLCNSVGQCVGCLKPADCPGTDSECGTRTCSGGGICGITFAAAGKPLATQVAGDCKVIQCDGTGTAVSVVNNADVPVDGNQCTNDRCTLGTPSNPVTALNSACNVSGKTFCDGAGVCVQCNAANQCAGSDTFCGVRTCAAKVCGMSFTAAGTVTPVQTTGDCKENQCNGAGASAPVNVNDPINDNNDCTDDLCNAGVPSNPPKAIRSVCAGGGGKVLCNGAGVCVQCTATTDCPGVDTFCGARTCTTGACGMSKTAAGTPLPTGQSAGDCHEKRCDGNGGDTNAVDDTDKPVDGNECTEDLCNAGVPSNPNVPNNTACTIGGNKCTNGVCG